MKTAVAAPPPEPSGPVAKGKFMALTQLVTLHREQSMQAQLAQQAVLDEVLDSTVKVITDAGR